MSQQILLCPKCKVELLPNSGNECRECATKYRKIAHCPECNDSLEVLKACGNVSYYCNCCRMQKSRTTIDWQFEAVSRSQS
ncbi:YfgJ family double zinc ribbon protein [Vibrio methylphosphonaticus]|uniref:YfgJ family double zinc ribbon protein n=1 Tax=Vibrio methylphosphonaticus TaxID=2946866 RepID=UPI0038732BF2